MVLIQADVARCGPIGSDVVISHTRSCVLGLALIQLDITRYRLITPVRGACLCVCMYVLSAYIGDSL